MSLNMVWKRNMWITMFSTLQNFSGKIDTWQKEKDRKFPITTDYLVILKLLSTVLEAKFSHVNSPLFR